MRLLIVEDDHEWRAALLALTQRTGYEVDAFANAGEALSSLHGRQYDLAIADLMLPDMHGIDLLQHLRAVLVGLPVLIVTALDALEDRVAALDAGADDYLVKPFEMRELEARVRALLRRKHTYRDKEIRVGPLVIVIGRRQVMFHDQSCHLTTSERTLLEALAIRADRVVSKQAISERLSRAGNPLSETAIEVCVHRLRRRINQLGLRVRTLRGFGYMLEVEEPASIQPE